MPDILNANPAVQSVDARKPILGSASGQPIIVFGGNDVLSWPLTTANNNDSTLGFACWYKPVSVGVSYELMFAISSLAGGTTGQHFMFYRNDSSLRVYLGYSPGNTRFGETAAATLTAGAWHFITGEYHSGLGTDAARIAITINGVVKPLTFTTGGAGGSGALFAVTGNALIGAQSNETTPGGPMLNGSALGIMFARTSPMAGITEGVWTPTARAALMALEAPIP